MTKIGLYFKTLSSNQILYEAIRSANKLLSIDNTYDFSLFYGNIGVVPITSNFGQFHSHSSWKFNGLLIATNVEDARFILRMPQCTRKILLCSNLEWYGFDRLPYEACLQAYRNPALEVWARSESHADALANSFNIQPKICKDFNYLELL